MVMASPKVMATTSTANPDLPRQQSLCPSLSTLISDLQNHGQSNSSDPSSMNMDDLLKNIYASPPPDHALPFPAASLPPSDDAAPAVARSVDDVWKEIVSGAGPRDPRLQTAEEMTLEDFLTKAGAVREEDVRAGAVPVGGPFPVETNTTHSHRSNNNNNSNVQLFGGNGMVMAEAVGGRGRGKRRAVEQAPVDKATQQRQKRMIKNRESAARSRERKQV